VPVRDTVVGGDRTLVDGESIEIAWAELAPRLEEAAIVRVLAAAHADAGSLEDGTVPPGLAALACQVAAEMSPLDPLWTWEHPLARLEKAEDGAR
jgi:hypothetical protein